MAHGAGCEREKMLPAGRTDALLSSELEVYFIDKSRGAQRVVALPAPALLVRNQSQLFVEEFDEQIEACGDVASKPVEKRLQRLVMSDLRHFHWRLPLVDMRQPAAPFPWVPTPGQRTMWYWSNRWVNGHDAAAHLST
jgi:hypothetical protein